jgi:hypothetical protein
MEANMPDRPLASDTREANAPRAGDSYIIGIVVLVAVLSALFLFATAMFSTDEKSVDVNTMQPSAQSPATDERSPPTGETP